jgi:hypothetical protein
MKADVLGDENRVRAKIYRKTIALHEITPI